MISYETDDWKALHNTKWLSTHCDKNFLINWFNLICEDNTVVIAVSNVLRKRLNFFFLTTKYSSWMTSSEKKMQQSEFFCLAGKYDPVNIIQNAVGIFYQNISISSWNSLINKSHIMVLKKQAEIQSKSSDIKHKSYHRFLSQTHSSSARRNFKIP